MILLKEYITTYLEFSQIFGDKLSLKRIEEIIKEWNCYPYSVLLSILCFYEMDEKQLKQIFFTNLIKDNPDFNTNKYLNIINKSIICSPQGLLCTWKYILINHQKIEKVISKNIEFASFQVMLLVTAIQDYLVKKDIIDQDLVSYLIRNLNFNTSENIRNSISRTWLMYFEPEIISNLQNTKEYVDYPSSFLNRYGYTLENYLASIMAIISFYDSKPNGFNKPWILDIGKYFDKTTLKEIINEIIDSLSFTWEEGREWAIETNQDNWNFRLFQIKPLLRIMPHGVIPVSKKFLHEQLFESLFYKIRNSYPEDDLSFVRYFGRPFESYVQWITEKSISKSKIGYKLIKEFTYNKNQNKSPDIMIKLGDKILVIEVKSTRISLAGLNSSKTIDKTLEKMVITPINQAIQSIKTIIKHGYHKSITSSNRYYFMVVSMSTFPTVNIYEDKIRKGLMYESGIEIDGFYHLDIEEFEYICEIIGRRGNRPIFRLLDNKFKNYYNYPFKNFLLKSSIHPRKYTLLSEKAKHLFDMVFSKLQSN